MDLFIRRPVATLLLMLALLGFGLLSYPRLPVSDLPNVDFPTIVVEAVLPGASPETMAAAVATPLEKQFSTIAGLDQMSSTSRQGITQITLQFTLERSIDAAAQDVQAAIAAVARLLPKDMAAPPSFTKQNPADSPIVYIALRSTTLPMSQLNEYAETILAPKISTVPGVAQVMIFGLQKYAVRVQVDPHELHLRKIGLDQVMQAIQDANPNLPTGTLWGSKQAVNVQSRGKPQKAEDFERIVVAYRQGAAVRLKDVGNVVDSVFADKTANWLVDERSIVLAVQRQPGSNTVAVARAVRALVPTFQRLLPAAAELQLLFDRSEPIQESVRDVQYTLVLTLVLVILVIFVFLRSVRATLIPSMALPLSIIGSFAVMWLFDFNLDNLSLMALTLSVGFVVDDAIVMLENIVRHVEMGKTPMQAALDGAKEIRFTILSMTLSLAAVFLPLLFMGGIVGRLFREFAVTIMAAILLSGVISLTLTPLMCSRLLKPASMEKHGWLYRATEWMWQGTLSAYQITLGWIMRHRWVAILGSVAILAGTVQLFQRVPKGFLPSGDLGQLIITTDAAEGISFDQMVLNQKQVAAIVRTDPGIESFMSMVSSTLGNTVGNQGRMFIKLKPRRERDASADQIIQRLRPKLSQLPGMRVFAMNPPPINLGSRFSLALYQFTIQSLDLQELYLVAPGFFDRLRSLPELQDVSTDLRLGSPELNLRVDQDRAATLGLSTQRVEDALYSAYGGRQISTILTSSNQYPVVLEVKPEYQRDPAALDLLYLRNKEDALVPLSAVVSIAPGVGPTTVNHSGQLASVTFSFNPRPGVSLDAMVSAVERTAREVLPAGVTTSFSGAAQAFKASQAGLAVLLVIAVLVIYFILGILYESFIHPITILSGLPFAGFGALLTLYLFEAELNLYSYVGMIMLIGVVKKNAIMMIDFAIERGRTTGMGARAACLEASSIRFRPIMMTTAAAILGTLPIAIGFGAGAETRRPLGLAVVGGLVISQLVTLYVTPVFYTYFDDLQRLLSRLFKRRREPSTPSSTP